jgi:cytochrome c556
MRSHAITLMESTNLLVMNGRKVLSPGQTMADEGVQGVISATEVQAKIDTNHEQFVQFSHSLHDVSADMLKAIDARNVQGMLDAGEAIDAACESCHMTFWYPNQVIPEFPDK